MTEAFAPVLDPFRVIWDGTLRHTPTIAAAVLVMIIGYLVGKLLGKVVYKIVEHGRLEHYIVERTGMKKLAGDFKLGVLLDHITKWYVFVVFLSAAVHLIELEPLANFLSKLSLWIPQAIAAVLIAFVGFIAADYISESIASIKTHWSKSLGNLARGITLIVVALVVLDQLGIQIDLISNSFLVILSGVMLAVALAIGIGFGLGMRDEASKVLKEWKKSL